ncbi:MAG TPA: hypothetical protein VM686_21175 [Polyangiaceae bacterium]|nr:hypothetical protein [Polyangiaceae bacterium]
MARLGFAVLFALSCSACGSKGAVALLSGAENPSLTVEQAALGASLSGGFELVLELGDYADEGVDVSLAGFGIYRGDEELVSSLSLSSDVDFPVHVEPGKSQRARLSIDMTGTLDSAVADALCEGNVAYRGGVTDAGGKLTPAASAEFAPSCP